MKEWKIPLKKLKKSVRDDLEDRGAYALEYVFNKECSGHGAGFGGEDIDFEMMGYLVYFCLTQRFLMVTQTTKVWDNDAGEYPPIEITDSVKRFLTSHLIRKLPRRKVSK